MALRKQPAARIHRDLAVERRHPIFDELAALADLAQTQLFVLHQFRRRRRIVQFDDVDVLRPDAGDVVCLACHARGHARLAWRAVLARAQHRRRHPHRLGRKLPRLLFRNEHQRRGAVTDRRTHQACQRLRHDRRVQDLFDRVRLAILRVGI